MSLTPFSSPAVLWPNSISTPKTTQAAKSKLKSQDTSGQSPVTHSNSNPDYSIWRDTSLRYGGYADEVGEFLSPYLGSVGTFLGYGISSAYVAADMLTTLPQKYKEASPTLSKKQKILQTSKEALDLSIFHVFATLLIPPMLIGAVVKSTGILLNPVQKSANQPEATGFSPVKYIEKTRELIETGLEKTVSPMAPHTQRWAKLYTEAVHGRVIGDAGNAKADRWISKHGKNIARMINPVAKTAQALSKTPVLNWFVSKELAEELSHNVSSIASKKTFNLGSKELANLIFIKPIPVMVGIGMVPLIAHPFDELMLKLQDWTIRPLLGKNKIVRDNQGRLKSVKNQAFWGFQDKTVPNHAGIFPTTNQYPAYSPMLTSIAGLQALQRTQPQAQQRQYTLAQPMRFPYQRTTNTPIISPFHTSTLTSISAPAYPKPPHLPEPIAHYSLLKPTLVERI